MNFAHTLLAASLLTGAVFSPRVGTMGLGLLAVSAMLLYTWLSRSLAKTVLVAIPLAIFASVLWLLQKFSGQADPMLPLRTLAICFLSVTAFRALTWERALLRVPPDSHIFILVLFALTMRHFVIILAAETRRIFKARTLAVPRQYRQGWFHSLSWAVAAVVRASLVRAERFYAGLLLRGFAG